MPIPKKPKKVEQFIAAAHKVETKELVITLRFKPDLVEQMDAAAKELNLNRSSWIRYAISKELKR